MNQVQALVTVSRLCLDSRSAICCMAQLPYLHPGDGMRLLGL